MGSSAEENPLNIPMTPSPEKFSEETIPIINGATHNATQEAETMEVHHHPHVGNKNVKEYFLEGFMIFIAVCLGFIAENIRHYYMNKDIEKRNMEMVVVNLKDDLDNLKEMMYRNKIQIFYIDTLLRYQSYPSVDSIFKPNYFIYVKHALTNFNYKSNTSAIDQMKSSGNLRLVSNKEVLLAIADYEVLNKIIIDNQNYIFNNTSRAIELLGKFSFLNESVDPDVMTAQIERMHSLDDRLNHRNDRYEFYNIARMKKTLVSSLLLKQMEMQGLNAEKLIQLLEKEYDMLE